ncbi:hypothetical protein BCR41DRAFT_152494 [Lobosporangium transversale]|uniref:PH domain-containing protein n=1 Tax=Lobosporangium transversale TaxID=64571 RepID=A0A1Y2GY91_9FUNG|nr:hypothetical protein BCR41DRAFT_152494 [Lobosporangium transversale]ORZ27259.1 hypothetical protein BCR41DRAFT_152494 [Lobosporangium transversale]|eukprot:XP_021884986.1 hypothetical protein BCR41DRAFT_152494 [Lobosporangium transversale]
MRTNCLPMSPITPSFDPFFFLLLLLLFSCSLDGPLTNKTKQHACTKKKKVKIIGLQFHSTILQLQDDVGAEGELRMGNPLPIPCHRTLLRAKQRQASSLLFLFLFSVNRTSRSYCAKFVCNTFWIYSIYQRSFASIAHPHSGTLSFASHPGVTRPSIQYHFQQQHQIGPLLADRSGSAGINFGVALSPRATPSVLSHGQQEHISDAPDNGRSGSLLSRSPSSAPSVKTPSSPRPSTSSPLSAQPRVSLSLSTPSSPIQSSFSSPELPKLSSSSSFASLHEAHERNTTPVSTATLGASLNTDQSAKSLLSPDKGTLPLSVDTTALPPTVPKSNSSLYIRQNTKSIPAGGVHQKYPQSRHSPQQRPQKTNSSLSTLANIDHNGKFTYPQIGEGVIDPTNDTSMMSINVRYVSKDLWVRVEVPKDSPVHRARDLILERCQYIITPPSAPSSLTGTSIADEDATRMLGKEEVASIQGQKIDEFDQKEVSRSGTVTTTKVVSQTVGKMPLTRPRSKSARATVTSNDTPLCHMDQSPEESSLKINNSKNSNDNARHSCTSLDSEGSKLTGAATLMERLGMFEDSIHGFGDELARCNYAKVIASQKPPNYHKKNDGITGPSNQQRANQPIHQSKAQQLRRLLSNSSIQSEESNIHGTKPPDHVSRDASTPNRISGWTHLRDRHNSYPGKNIERSVASQDDMLVECTKHRQSEASKVDYETWKHSFGLFWVAAGHWLDDSRTISSYKLNSQDLLELQLRNHYIELPPPGGNLSYYDHYAEGTLFKLSKKSRPASVLTNHGGREPTGVWKERWVVLQGSKLLIYHKRKDSNKKIIELPLPLNITTKTLPPNSRHLFKNLTSSATNMSTTMIALNIPPGPELCFRGPNEHEINHWTRIFNSLNNEASPLNLPMYIQGTEPMSLNSNSNQLESSSTLPSIFSGYPSERKRNHTINNGISFSHATATMPSIDPVLISNAAAAISNLNGGGSNNPSRALNSHYRNMSHSNHVDGRDSNSASPHHHSVLPGACAAPSSSIKEDIRRRAITEPNRPRSMNSQVTFQYQPARARGLDTDNSGSLRTLDVTNTPEIPFQLTSPSDGKKRRPILGTEYLDNASQILLATSSARSSTAPLYSGYIWIYLPDAMNENNSASHETEEESIKTPDQPSVHVNGRMSNPPLPALPLPSALPSSSAPSSRDSKRSKIDDEEVEVGHLNDRSGRYVKCFAAISDQGHFQWVEVKKQTSLENAERELKAQLRTGSSSLSRRVSYSIDLRYSQRDLSASHLQQGCPSAGFGRAPEPEPLSKSPHEAPRRPPIPTAVQVSMAERIHMYFFCIKIPPSVLKGALSNIAVETSPSPPSQHTSTPLSSSPLPDSSTAASATNNTTKVANKIRHRFSSSLSTLTTSAALPPLPGMKSQSLSGSISKSGFKNMAWSSMTSPQDKEPSVAQAQPKQLSLHPVSSAPQSSGDNVDPARSITHKDSMASFSSTHHSTAAYQQQPWPTTPTMESESTAQGHADRGQIWGLLNQSSHYQRP